MSDNLAVRDAKVVEVPADEAVEPICIRKLDRLETTSPSMGTGE